MNKIMKALYVLAGNDIPEDEDELYDEADAEAIQIDDSIFEGVFKIAVMRRVPVTYYINRVLAADITKPDNAKLIGDYDKFYAGREENELKAIRQYQATLKSGRDGGRKSIFRRWFTNAQ